MDMTLLAPRAGSLPWREFVALLDEAVIVLDTRARVVYANPAALRWVSLEAGTPLAALEPDFGAAAVAWLTRAAQRRADAEAVPPLLRLASGRTLGLTCSRLDERHCAVRLVEAQAPDGPLAPGAAARELDDWFALSPVGMVLFDAAGTLLRINPAFQALVGAAPATLVSAPAELQALLGWQEGAPAAALQASALPIVCKAVIAAAGAGPRHLRATVRCCEPSASGRRYMAVVEDRSVEEERDLAQLQVHAMMDTVGAGLATFRESSGWVRGRQPPPGAGSAALPPTASAALQSISRELVVAASLPEFERLQAALRQARRAEVRYEILHPELGARWLLTRVEPAVLASGQRTTSVVTLDVTEQHRSQEHGAQLLREMTTILESMTAGIAYLRGEALVRCNRRFEAMLGLGAAAESGTPLARLFGRHVDAGRMAVASLQALAAGEVHETQLELAGDAGERRWYSLSVRRAGAGADPTDAIAVLSDVTGMKTQQLELEILARDRELMFSLSEVGIAFVRDRRIQRANGALAELTGWPVADLVSVDLAELFVDAADFERRFGEEEQALARHGRWSGERQLRRRDGRLVWVQISKRLVDREHPGGGMIASYVDVDARHRAERAVALQADRTRSILDSALVGIVNVGPRGIEWMNRSARRMFGGALAEFIGEPMSCVATAEPDHPFRRTQYLNELVEGQAETFECRVRARDGREFWIVGNAVATEREPSGRQLTYALLDIERRRQAEARMSEAQSALQQVIAAAPLAITLIDARSFKVVQANPVAALALQATPEALVGRTPEQIFAPEVAAARRRDLEQALLAPGVTSFEYRSAADAAEPARVWDARCVPLSRAPGQPPDQLLLVATDVTEQRAAQEARLEAAIEQREMLVREVHHRIKNNLQGVAGLLQQIAERKPEVAPVIAEVVGQVQAIAQVYGLQVGAQGTLHLVGVVEAITASVQRNFGQPILCEVARGSGPAWILPEAEAIPIALTLNELLTNAVKHTAAAEAHAPAHRGASAAAGISCRVDADEHGVRIAIANAGTLPPGFSLEGIRGGVSGLGLVRALLPRRHARLTIEEQGVRVVATVTLEPPVVSAGPPLSPTIAPGPLRGAAERTP